MRHDLIEQLVNEANKQLTLKKLDEPGLSKSHKWEVIDSMLDQGVLTYDLQFFMRRNNRDDNEYRYLLPSEIKDFMEEVDELLNTMPGNPQPFICAFEEDHMVARFTGQAKPTDEDVKVAIEWMKLHQPHYVELQYWGTKLGRAKTMLEGKQIALKYLEVYQENDDIEWGQLFSLNYAKKYARLVLPEEEVGDAIGQVVRLADIINPMMYLDPPPVREPAPDPARPRRY